MLTMIGIAGVAWLTGVRQALVHRWRVNSPRRIGDAGWQGKLGCRTGLVRYDRDTGLRRGPISK